LSKYLGDLTVGQEVAVKGPKGQFIYKPGLVKAFGMIAGKFHIMYFISSSINFN
jgi:cytochrome-b5 reductase